MTQEKVLKKPLLRGYLHQESFFVALGACILLLVHSSSRIAFVASLVYSFGLLLMFGVSAIYHRPNWEPKPRAILKRLDHSAIFVLIASSATPISLLALSEEQGLRLLVVFWTAGVIGIVQSLFWVKAPKYITAIFYVVMGWLAFPYLDDLQLALGSAKVALIVGGGVVYTVGAVFYALKWPKLVAHIFGYHELFHLFTIIGAALHFVVIYQLVG